MGMNAHELVIALSATRTPRASLYLNHERVDELFGQQLGAIQQISRSESTEAKVSTSLLQLLGLELAGKKEHEITASLDPLLKAILLEYSARSSGTLLDLTRVRARAGALLIHLGQSSLVDVDASVANSEALTDVALRHGLEAERKRQELRMQRAHPSLGTMVWLTQIPWPMASIASERWVGAGSMASYGYSGPFGILGRFERTMLGMDLIAPLWIWHEGA